MICFNLAIFVRFIISVSPFSEIKLAQIDSYIRKLIERERRRDLIREYDLVSEFFRQERPLLSAPLRYTPQASIRLKRERYV